MTNIYGYARVSSKDQMKQGKLFALSQFPVKRKIFILISLAVRILIDPSTVN